MNITIVAQRFPFPLDRGDRLTIYHLVKHLSQRHRVTLVTFTEPYHERAWEAELRPYCARIENLPMLRWRSYVNCITGAVSTLPLQLHYNYDPAMARLVDRVVQGSKPDLLYAHYIRMGRYTEKYRQYPRVLAMQLSMTLNYQRLAENATDWVHKMLYTIEYQKLRRFEANFARQFDKVMLISPRDLEAMAADPPLTNVFFNPHGVDFDHFKPDPTVAKEPNSLIFTGNMKYMPNVDAITYFCRQILPLVRQAIPDVRLSIVGTRPLPEVVALAEDPAITVTGRVPDLRDYLQRAQVAIAPMRTAAGLLNKVLEGMSMGLPMVVSPMANEGIRAAAGKEILIGETPQAFADHIVTLLRDPARRQEVGSAARDFILNQWSWTGYLQELEQMFCELVDRFPHQQQAPAAPSLPVWAGAQPAVVRDR